MTPTARSLAWLRARGWIAGTVERWIPNINIRHDLWGCADLIAAHSVERQILLVQVTTSDHVAHRLAKAKVQPELVVWLRAGGLFHVHGWAKRNNGKWHVRRVEVVAQDLEPVDLTPRPKAKRQRKGERQQNLWD